MNDERIKVVEKPAKQHEYRRQPRHMDVREIHFQPDGSVKDYPLDRGPRHHEAKKHGQPRGKKPMHGGIIAAIAVVAGGALAIIAGAIGRYMNAKKEPSAGSPARTSSVPAKPGDKAPPVNPGHPVPMPTNPADPGPVNPADPGPKPSKKAHP